MNHSEKLEAVRAKIIAACPDVMELKFGCKIDPQNKALGIGILIEQKKTEECISWHIFYPEMDNSVAEGLDSKEYNTYWHKGCKPNYKILGSPIGIAEVLKSINKMSRFYYGVGSSGHFIEYILGQYNLIESEKLGRFVKWNFEKNNLNDQSEEVISFLYSIFYP